MKLKLQFLYWLLFIEIVGRNRLVFFFWLVWNAMVHIAFCFKSINTYFSFLCFCSCKMFNLWSLRTKIHRKFIAWKKWCFVCVCVCVCVLDTYNRRFVFEDRIIWMKYIWNMLMFQLSMSLSLKLHITIFVVVIGNR